MEQWSSRVKRTCVGVMVLACFLRLGGSSPVAVEPDAETAAFLLYLATGRAGHLPEEVPDPETLPPETETVPRQERTFSAEDVQIKYGTEARPDAERLLNEPVDLDFSGPDPRVLIVHTHATESYTQEPGWEYESQSNYRTLDENYNMVRVGRTIADRLNRAGIVTIHAEEYNDYPSYNASYDRARETIEAYLEQYPTIQMVIDVHRDAVEYADGTQMATAFSYEGRETAQLLLVMGTDEGGLYHPDWEDNLAWALKLQAALLEKDTDLVRPLSLRPERYNEHETPGSILLEVGTAGDTLSAALNGAEVFADTLIEVIDGLGLR